MKIEIRKTHKEINIQIVELMIEKNGKSIPFIFIRRNDKEKWHRKPTFEKILETDYQKILKFMEEVIL